MRVQKCKVIVKRQCGYVLYQRAWGLEILFVINCFPRVYMATLNKGEFDLGLNYLGLTAFTMSINFLIWWDFLVDTHRYRWSEVSQTISHKSRGQWSRGCPAAKTASCSQRSISLDKYWSNYIRVYFVHEKLYLRLSLFKYTALWCWRRKRQYLV